MEQSARSGFASQDALQICRLMLKNHMHRKFAGAQSQMTVPNGQTLSIDELVIGDTAHDSLYDESGVLLVAKGVQITVSLIDKLRRRGIKTLHAGSNERKPAPPVARTPRIDRPQRQAVPRISPNYSAKKIQRIQSQFSAGQQAVTELCDAIRQSSLADLRRTDAHVEQYIGELIDDPDPVIAGALLYEADLDLARRCVQFSVLSMAIAQQMETDEKQLCNIGSAALVHDWSLFDLPPDSRYPHQPMSEEIRQQCQRHPITTVEMLDTVRHVETDVKLFVSQVHEYLDGTGFPRQLRADRLHPASRILGVADAYLTMTAPPKGSPRIVPCDAVAFLINGASQGRYSPKAVSGLLHAVTLYPIGSIVELSDTTKARVIRSNGKDYGYPIVESLADTARVINLKEESLFVTRPILSTEYHEVRLPETQKQLEDAIAGV